jgi:hypothetical protein
MLPPMTRKEAEQLRTRLSAEHPDRETHSFILSERNDVWTVAKVALPPTAEASATPSEASPSPLHDRAPGRLPAGLPNWSAGA